MSSKLNRMSVMDMRLPAGIYHLVKEAQCGRHYKVGYGGISWYRVEIFFTFMNGRDSSSDELTLVSKAVPGPHRKC